MGNIKQRLRAGSHKYLQALRADHGYGQSIDGSALPSTQKTLIYFSLNWRQNESCKMNPHFDLLTLSQMVVPDSFVSRSFFRKADYLLKGYSGLKEILGRPKQADDYSEIKKSKIVYCTLADQSSA